DLNTAAAWSSHPANRVVSRESRAIVTSWRRNVERLPGLALLPQPRAPRLVQRGERLPQMIFGRPVEPLAVCDCANPRAARLEPVRLANVVYQRGALVARQLERLCRTERGLCSGKRTWIVEFVPREKALLGRLRRGGQRSDALDRLVLLADRAELHRAILREALDKPPGDRHFFAGAALRRRADAEEQPARDLACDIRRAWRGAARPQGDLDRFAGPVPGRDIRHRQARDGLQRRGALVQPDLQRFGGRDVQDNLQPREDVRQIFGERFGFDAVVQQRAGEVIQAGAVQIDHLPVLTAIAPAIAVADEDDRQRCSARRILITLRPRDRQTGAGFGRA